MKFDIIHRPASAAAKISLQAGEKVVCEAGSMIAMSSTIEVETSVFKNQNAKAGMFKAFKRMLAGESFFLNQFTARAPGEVYLSTPLPGDMQTIHMVQGSALMIQAGNFVATEPQITIDVVWQGLKNLFSGQSLFWVKVAGQGQVLVNAFGSIYEIEVNGSYVVDTGHIVAFDEGLKYNLSKAGSSWLHSFFGGEGIVCRFEGRGKVYCQSHNPSAFGSELTPYLAPKKA